MIMMGPSAQFSRGPDVGHEMEIPADMRELVFSLDDLIHSDVVV